ncbi:MAG: S1 RNA-binding domain-containing protein, partial [Polyangiaceae bacterium]|nr:S1 RNA-binding domain-containing protein [Polyangiaceae bacterium]
AAGADAADADAAGADAAGTDAAGSDAGSDSEPTNAESATAESPKEAGADADATAEASTADGEAPKKKKRRRRKKKKPSADGPHAPERAPFHVGEQVFGKVTTILDTAIMVDLSGKALALFDRGEMEADDLIPEIGENFVGQVLGDGGRGGLVVLTRKPLREEETKPKVEAAAKDGTLVEALVTGVIKGGVEVLIDGLRAFAPASGVDLHPRNANLQQLVGQRLDFKVTTFEKQGREVVVTRRPMLEKEAHERRKKARELLKDGMEMQGVVRTIVDWGAFIALPEAEYLEGLVHISELSHNPREKVADVLKPGQKLQVKIQKIDEKGKIWLSRKALIEDPFAKLTEGIKVGDIVEGKVARVEEFGAFITLTEGFEGLCHVSDLSINRIPDARTVVKEGDDLKVLIHHIDSRNRRVALHPAPTGEQAEEERQKVARNSKVKVAVTKIDKGGLQVRVLGATGRQARGFIPAGQTGTPRGAELRKHFTENQKLDAMVIDVDPRRGEAKLSLTRLAQDEERRAHKEYRQKLKAEANFGTLGDLLKSKLGG